jgi:hypothetical protein
MHLYQTIINLVTGFLWLGFAFIVIWGVYDLGYQNGRKAGKWGGN